MKRSVRDQTEKVRQWLDWGSLLAQRGRQTGAVGGSNDSGDGTGDQRHEMHAVV